jgi:ATP-dependent Lhr-like helicase
MESLMRGGERAFYEALLKAKEEYLVYKKFIDKREGKEDREKA